MRPVRPTSPSRLTSAAPTSQARDPRTRGNLRNLRGMVIAGFAPSICAAFYLECSNKNFETIVFYLIKFNKMFDSRLFLNAVGKAIFSRLLFKTPIDLRCELALCSHSGPPRAYLPPRGTKNCHTSFLKK